MTNGQQIQRSKIRTRNTHTPGAKGIGRSETTSAPRVQIMYSCGDYICDGPEILYSRLHRFSTRARRELQGARTWTVECQHYEQDFLLDKIFQWLMTLPDREPPRNFVARGYHPEIDPDNEWVPQLSWKHLILLDHTLDYLHLTEPLDNRKVRSLIWKSLPLKELELSPLSAEDMHLAWHLLQFKGDWIREAGSIQNLPHAAPASARTKSTSNNVTASSALEEELIKILDEWEPKNSALMRNMIRKVVAYLEKRGTSAFDSFIKELQQIVGDHPNEDNSILQKALIIVYEDRNSRPTRRQG